MLGEEFNTLNGNEIEFLESLDMLNSEMQRMILFNFPHHEQRFKKYMPQRLQYFDDVDKHIQRLRNLVLQRMEDVKNNVQRNLSEMYGKDLVTTMVEGCLNGKDTSITPEIILVKHLTSL